MHQSPISNRCDTFCLDQTVEAPADFSAQVDDFTRLRGSVDLDRAQGRQLQISKRRHRWITLGHDARELRERLDQEHARKYGLPGKMATQKIFRAANRIRARTGFSGIECGELIDETKFRTMRQPVQGRVERIAHFRE